MRKKASEIYGRLGETMEQAVSLMYISRSLITTEGAIDLFSENGVFSALYINSRAIYHFEVALGTASLLNQFPTPAWIHFTLGRQVTRDRRQ